MTKLGIIGAGEVGSQLARAAISLGWSVAIANSRGPETLEALVSELGPMAQAVTAAQAASFGDFIVIAVPLKLENNMPVEELTGKIVLDTNNYMAWRDGGFPEVEEGRKTVHELRQEQLPRSKVVKAFSHIQAPNLFLLAKPDPAGMKHALAVSSDYPDAAETAAAFYRALGFDVVDNSPLSQSWRTEAGQPAWNASFTRQSRQALSENLQLAQRRRPQV